MLKGVKSLVAGTVFYMIISALLSFACGHEDELALLREALIYEQPVVAVAGPLRPETVAQGADELAAALDEILQDARLDGAVAGVSVRLGDTGELLYSHQGDIRLHPASNMKILTAVAALEMLGPDYRFTTELLTDGEIKDGTLVGNLYLRGRGDPTLTKEDLDRFAEQVLELGIKRIEGHLIGDDSWYDDIRLSLDLDWSDEPYYTGTQVSALTLSPNNEYDAGTVIVEVSPGASVGSEPQVKVIPETGYVTIINEAVTGGSREGNTIKVEREHGTNRIFVTGQIPLGGTTSRVWASVWEPTGYVLDVFSRSLKKHGITFDMVSETLSGVTPEDATLLASRSSIPLSELLIPFMKLSNNGHGEILTKEMGRVIHGEGSWTIGLQVISEVLAGLGVNTDTIVLRDGSGMSHITMIPADELSYLLYAIQSKSWYPVFERSLPVAGAADRLTGGTLRLRMRGTAAEGNVKAKTGSLTSVSTLSGYVTSSDGEKLIFSILINNYVASSVRPVEDRIAITLANWKLR